MFRSWQELEKAFEKEIKEEWQVIYNNVPFVDRIIKKAFYYYDTNPLKKPTDRGGWKRALDSFLSKNFNTTTAAPNPPVQRGTPFVRSAPRKEGVDVVYADLGESCGGCLDLGIVRVVSLTEPPVDTLMLCDCADNKDHSNWDLPKWDRALVAIYRKEKCPINWFKPQRVNPGDAVDLRSEPIMEKIRQWQRLLISAQEHWGEVKESVQST